MADEQKRTIAIAEMQAVVNYEHAIYALEHQKSKHPPGLSEAQLTSRIAVLTVAVGLMTRSRDESILRVRQFLEEAGE